MIFVAMTCFFFAGLVSGRLSNTFSKKLVETQRDTITLKNELIVKQRELIEKLEKCLHNSSELIDLQRSMIDSPNCDEFLRYLDEEEYNV